MAIIDDINAVVKKIRNAIKSVKDEIQDNVNKIVKPLKDKIDDLKDDLEGWMLQQFIKVKMAVIGHIDDLRRSIKSVKNSISTLGNKITGFLNLLVKSTRDSILQIKTLVSNIVSRVVIKVKTDIAIFF